MTEEEKEQAFQDWLERSNLSEIVESLRSEKLKRFEEKTLELYLDRVIESAVINEGLEETDFVGTPWIPS